MAGTIKLDGTTFLSKSGSDFTLNNIANHGTITSATTFPSGHIIKSSGQINHATTGSWDTTSSTYLTIKESDGSTPISTGAFTFTAGNKVLIMWSANVFPHNGGTNVGQYCRISTASTDNNNFISGMGDTQTAYIYVNTNISAQLGVTANFVYTDSPSGTSVTYYFQTRASHGGTVQYNRAMSHVHLFEIQA